jgi:serpin B
MVGLGLTVFSALVASAFSQGGPGGQYLRPSPDELRLIEANNRFAFDLLKRLPQDGDNLIVSPFSVSAALAMTYAGARGETADRIAQVLHVAELGPRVHPAFSAILRKLDQDARRGGDLLEVANALWGRPGLEFWPGFREALHRDYGADLITVNFAEPVEASRIINGWAATKTRGFIKDVVQPGAISPRTPLLLTDAIYFKGGWAKKFSRDATKTSRFHTLDGNVLDVPFMYQLDRFRHLQDANMEILELPYGGDLVMDILLPRELNGLAGLERDSSLVEMQPRLSQLGAKKVEVFLPRFRFSKQLELSRLLSELGMQGVFGGGADFSGMIPEGRGLVLAALIHKSYVEVDETGTTAAAVTAPVFQATDIKPAGHAVFRADHPFLFLIRDRASNCIYFIGRVTHPESL